MNKALKTKYITEATLSALTDSVNKVISNLQKEDCTIKDVKYQILNNNLLGCIAFILYEEPYIKELTEVKSQLDSIEDKKIKCIRWKPILGQHYFYLDDEGAIVDSMWHNTVSDLFRFNTGNCFETRQETKEYKENLLTKQALKDLALELNNGVEIDWNNFKQEKSYIYLDFDCKYNLNASHTRWFKELGSIYCLNKDFLTIAIERIGEEKLIKLIKSGV